MKKNKTQKAIETIWLMSIFLFIVPGSVISIYAFYMTSWNHWPDGAPLWMELAFPASLGISILFSAITFLIFLSCGTPDRDEDEA